MNYMALYRKYRPSSFNELVGQKYIVDILKKSLESDKISHAYLFSGPRGTGKTSIAKLLAKLVNCKDRNGLDACNECESCILINNKNNPDIIEMDAASNNGVDEIREIRDKVGLMPSVSKYKVYIIDEVHMLSTGAFNALLKTLEEPPKHVIFILATTEFYKVPETIVSRCQCFEFSRINEIDIVKRLSHIVSLEDIKIDDQVLNLIAKYSDGGMRDAIGFLDKLSCYKDKITVDDFYSLKGIVTKDSLNELIDNIYNGNLEKSLEIYYDFVNKGKNIGLLLDDLIEVVKDILIDSLKRNNDYDIDILYKYLDILDDYSRKIKVFSDPKVMFEVCILKMVENSLSDKIISREIIGEKNSDENTIFESNEELSVDKLSNNVKSNVNNNTNHVNSAFLEKDVKNDDYNVEKCNYIERQNIIINNAFALANKSLLEELKIRWVNLSDYLHNKEFANVVSYLLDGSLRVAGEKDVIISVRYDSLVTNALISIDKIQVLFNIIAGKYYNIAFITEDDWKNLRNEYVTNLKSGKKYQYIEQKVKNDDIIESDDSLNSDSETISDAISLFGDDLVEVK